MIDKPNWIPETKDFIEADVIRWVENIWSKKKRGRGKHAKHILLGKQLVTGQIKEIDKTYIHIKIIEAEMVENNGAKPQQLRKSGDIIRKKLQSLFKANTERLLWESEETRANIIAEKNLK